MSGPPATIASTYGPWLISLILETALYGMGVTQAWCYFQWYGGRDGVDIKIAVFLVMLFETTQIVFFSRSSYFRFVAKFGVAQEDLVWSDSLQLLANYISAFIVQMYFASRIYHLTRERTKLYATSTFGVVVIVLLSLVQMGAGLAQTIVSYRLRSFAKLVDTKAITTLQTAGSLACDIGITIYLCAFFNRHKNGMERTHALLNILMLNAIGRGLLTAISSALTMILFLVAPDTFYFFLSLAPCSKLYMNSMLLTLNMRLHIRNKALSHNREWIGDSWQLSDHSRQSAREPISTVEFVHPPHSTMDSSDDISRAKASVMTPTASALTSMGFSSTSSVGVPETDPDTKIDPEAPVAV